MLSPNATCLDKHLQISAKPHGIAYLCSVVHPPQVFDLSHLLCTICHFCRCSQRLICIRPAQGKGAIQSLDHAAAGMWQHTTSSNTASQGRSCCGLLCLSDAIACLIHASPSCLFLSAENECVAGSTIVTGKLASRCLVSLELLGNLLPLLMP